MKIIKNNLFMLKYIWNTNKIYFIGMVFVKSIFSAINTTIDVLIIKYIIDLVFIEGSLIEIIILLLIKNLVSIIVYLLDLHLNTVVTPKISIILSRKLNEEIINKAQKIDLECYDNNEFYNNYTKALLETDNRVWSVFNNIISLFSNIFTTIGIISVILSIDPILIIFVTITILIRTFIIPKINKIRYNFNQERTGLDRKIAFYKSSFHTREYAKDIRTIENLGNILKLKFKYYTEEYLKLNNKYTKKIYKKISIINLADIIFANLIPYAYLVLQGYMKRITIGSIGTLFSAMHTLSYAISGILNCVIEMSNNNLYINNYKYILNYKCKIEVEDNSIECKYIDTIEFKNVYFKYTDNSDYVLKDINFKINKNEKLAIIGYNGAGKSTIIKLLLRLYDVTSGEILINDSNIKSFNIETLRYKFSVMFQDYNLYPFTLIENLTFNINNDINNEKIAAEALNKIGLYDKVFKSEEKLNTNVTKKFDNNGIIFSGGEEQKLAIARSYILKSSIDAFIFDEPSSALDPISEDNFYKNVLEIVDNKISVFITHKMSLLNIMDKICLLENGVIIEFGKFNDLMNNSEKFYNYYSTQAKYYNVNYELK